MDTTIREPKTVRQTSKAAHQIPNDHRKTTALPTSSLVFAIAESPPPSQSKIATVRRRVGGVRFGLSTRKTFNKAAFSARLGGRAKISVTHLLNVSIVTTNGDPQRGSFRICECIVQLKQRLCSAGKYFRHMHHSHIPHSHDSAVPLTPHNGTRARTPTLNWILHFFYSSFFLAPARSHSKYLLTFSVFKQIAVADAAKRALQGITKCN